MAKISRTRQAFDRLLDAIIAGDLVAGEPLPAEGLLAEQYEVSRVTIREAVRLLQAQGVIVPVPGSRHRIAHPDEWTGLEAVVRVSRRSRNRERSSLELLEMRMMIETGAAELAATRRTDADLAELGRQLDRMREAHDAADVAAFVEADLAFHEIIMRAADNRILIASMLPLTMLLQETRAETSAVPSIRVHAIDEHVAILDALRGGTTAAARKAMRRHMRQTQDDLQHYVHGS